MFTCYFDASGGKDLKVMIVSGWISEINQWELFEGDWRILLAHYDLPYFHMKEFAHSKGPFASWKGKEGQRSNFLRMAVDTIANRVHRGFTCVVEYESFYAIDAEYELSKEAGNPYSLAARDCMAHANLWLKKSRRGISVDYVFEDGDGGKGLLLDMIDRHNKVVTGFDTISLPIFRPSRDREGQKGIIQLQAADFAAYEWLKAYRTGDDEPLYKYRKSVQALARIPSWVGKYTKTNLIEMCEKAGIPKRTKAE